MFKLLSLLNLMYYNFKYSPVNRHHMDAGNCEPHIQQRRPTLVANCPKLDSSSLAGATLFCCDLENLIHHTSSYYHTLASSPAGPHPAGLQTQGQIYTFNNSRVGDHTVVLLFKCQLLCMCLCYLFIYSFK